MLRGLMQDDHPLTLQHVLERQRRFHAEATCVSATAEGATRTSYGEIAARVDRAVSGLQRLGIAPGDRVATLAWNTREHFEVYLAAPCAGAVLHTLNARLSPEQIEQIVTHAQDRVIFVDRSLAGLLASLRDRLPSVERIVVFDADEGPELAGAIGYEAFLAEADAPPRYPALEDRAAAGLCYTSGTTGEPKGVLYSHRSLMLHSLMLGTADVLGVGTRERILPVVPMFHANAWGIPYAAALLGAELVLPNRFLSPEPLARLIEEERPTIAAGVATVWHGLLRHADEHGTDLSSLRLLLCGGAPMPRSLMEAFEDRHGVRMVQAWGMTETAPFAAVATPPAGVDGERDRRYRSRTGRLVPLLDMRVVGDDGAELPWDDEHAGELHVRGPWIASQYYAADGPDERFADGWLRTGDVVRITPDGFVTITDRAKDLIKSGGEWISSVELENHLMAHPAVAEAAVVARADERWGERPAAFVVRAPGASCDAAALREHLTPLVPSWWLPDPQDVVFVEGLPKTSVGKFDKKAMRALLAPA